MSQRIKYKNVFYLYRGNPVNTGIAAVAYVTCFSPVYGDVYRLLRLYRTRTAAHVPINDTDRPRQEQDAQRAEHIKERNGGQMRDIKKQAEQGLAIIRKHERADLRADEILQFTAMYDKAAANGSRDGLYDVIRAAFLMGVAVGNRQK